MVSELVTSSGVSQLTLIMSVLCDIISTVLDAVILFVIHDVEPILVLIWIYFFALIKVTSRTYQNN